MVGVKSIPAVICVTIPERFTPLPKYSIAVISPTTSNSVEGKSVPIPREFVAGLNTRLDEFTESVVTPVLTGENIG